MLCDLCHKNIATVHLTEIVNNKVAEMHICQSCAQVKAEEINQQPNISDFLSGMVSSRGKKEEQTLKCPACSFIYADFKKKGRLGCDSCYSSFKRQVLPLLKKIHGTNRHTGKIPVYGKKLSKSASSAEKLKDLSRKLERAIQLEEYEDAARIRDQIKRLSKKNKS